MYKSLIAALALMFMSTFATIVGCGGSEGGGGNGGGGPTCTAPECFEGEPQSQGDLLNACVGGCVPFDNSTRLPRLGANCELPELP